MIAVFRDLPESEPDDSKLSVLAHTRLKELKQKIQDTLPETHVITLE